MIEPPDHEVTVFSAARQLSPGQRAAFLDRACAGDAALRQRVEELLEAGEEAGVFLESPVIRSTIVPPEKVGDLIGHYKLLQQIGEGGCGVVYMAEQEEPIQRKVALKVIKLGMDTKSVIARFEAERQALALMDHPNIAKVLDAGATETGRPYFVMELVRGIKITDYCDQNNLSAHERLDLFIQICRAIQHAHQKGIIHRDIKPSNILVTINDGVAVPKVIDFGIAKATQGRLTDKTLFTAFEQFMGTPAYMSPEQAEMSALDIDTRSDIYSLGVLLYELLTGQTPFNAKELLKAGLDEIRRTIREQEPARPSTCLSTMRGAALTAIARQRKVEAPGLVHLVRGDLDWIVMKALEKDRTRRYETANDLAADIQRHLGNEPVVARPPSNAYRFQKMVRRNKLAFASATAIAVALIIGITVSAWQAVRATCAGTLAEQRLAESEAISKFLTEVFQSPDPARDGRTITVAETLGTAAKKLETDLANQPARRAKLQATLGMTYYGLGFFNDAIKLEEKVLDYYRSTVGLESPDTLDAMHNLANSYDDGGHRDEALKLREQELALSRKVFGPEHRKTIKAMHDLATSYGKADRGDEALKLREQVLTLQRKVLGSEHPDTLSAMHNLANSYDKAGRSDQALKLREQVLALRRKVNGPEHPDTLKAMNNLADSYDKAGRRDEALKLGEETLAIRRKVLGPEHPDTLLTMNNLAFFYDEVGRVDEALKLREQVLTLEGKVLGPEHPDTLNAMHELADSYVEAGRRSEALELREEGLALRRKTLGPEHPDTLSTMHDLADSYVEAGRKDEALKLREELVAGRRKVLSPEHPDTLHAINDLAESYDEVGRRDDALKLRKELLAPLLKTPEIIDPLTLNDVAWMLATSDSAGVSNGPNAVRLAEIAVAENHRKNAWYLDTLAAAYAETQQFDKAVVTQQEAIGLLQSEPEKKDYASRLKLYQANTPYREP